MPYSRAVSQRPAHEPALDGLRGLTALIVVVRHSFNAMVLPPGVRMALAQSPLAPLLHGQGAVQIFFILSGFVLAGSLERSGERAPWPQFYVRRVFRIHPPYLVALAIALAVAALGPGPASPTLQPAVPPLPDAGQLAAWVSFPGKAGRFLPVGWTLTVEMAMSFALPLFVLAAGFARGIPLVAACLALLFAFEHMFATYAIDFALGVVAWRERETIGRWLAKLGANGRGAFAVIALFVWLVPMLFWPRMLHGFLLAGWWDHEIIVMAIGAVSLVVCSTEVPSLRRVLSHPACLFLGRTSYASYLLHWTVLTWLAPRVVDGTASGNAAVLVSTFVATTLLSVPFHRYIELPSIAAGNWVCRRIAAKLRTRAIQSTAGNR
jgi:peptidoglycan/LPS O-acetylase OafA/YrhL